MRAILATLILAITFPTHSHAQWEIEESHTTASLRGIHNVGGGVAWASGTNGTVLRTEDGGYLWQTCAIPPGAEKLDFRGIQAFDEKTAIVMSSGPGDLSRLYKTTDGCQTWKLLFTNPDKDGFWDALRALNEDTYEIAGDSVDHTLVSEKSGHVLPVWRFGPGDDPDSRLSDYFFELHAEPNEGGFAGSNSTLVIGLKPHRDPTWGYQWLATQTPDHSYVHREGTEQTPTCEPCRMESMCVETPMSQGTSSAGIFSLAFREDKFGVAVGGDYQKPSATLKTAIFSTDAGKSWTLAQTPPHGYRSAVAYDAPTKSWITVGPNGTDISTDDGRNWRSLAPSSLDDKDANKNWNALSLPFVVGPKGRIGKLRATALTPATSIVDKPTKRP
ncbi:photosystem II stability/assembly factor-like uncharacterized protein [Granulicella aggregans]|uniref:Photosystem II stability/assembly factor-like uncharacterized protein n=2 Tax=Granulicella aggregans TaxID=474949 RepID=A0A7W7ZG68_9BACT|nr:photosystem II stability/assembly factor-like uncharacterized protein [Granulicella aggregans]